MVVSGHGDFQAARWDAYQSAQYVAVVDDDDRVLPGALTACVQALESTGAGLAFTDERYVDESGSPVGLNTFRPGTLAQLAMHPRVAHHLAVVRREALDPVVLTNARRFGCGIDWLAKGYAAMQAGAVHVPLIGYEWRRHPGGLCREPDEAQSFQRGMREMRGLIISWMKRNAPVRQFIPR